MGLKQVFKSKKFKKAENILILGLVVILFVSALVFTTIGILSKFTNKASEITYIEENGTKYLSIKDGFIAEELKIEAGELLPSLTSYFSTDYKIDDNATITYYDGEDDLEVSDFTFVKDNNTYVRGIMNLTALIKNNNEEYKTKLIIKDTQKPFVLLQDISITEGEAVDATKFVAIFVDNSQIVDFTATIVGTKQYVKVGTYDIQVNVCDVANNCVLDKANLIIKEREVIKEENISSFETGSGENNTPNEEEEKPNPDEVVPVVADPSLTSLKVSKGKLSPTFKSNTTKYKVTVENDVSSIKVTAKAASGSTFINGYGTRTVKLKVGENTIYVKVKNSDNKTVSYIINVTRKKKETSSDSDTSGGDSGGNDTTEPPKKEETERVFVGKMTSNNFPYRMIEHYGTKEYHVASEVTYNLYSDNYVEVLGFSGSVWTEWDFSGYKTDVKAMKEEAIDVLEANASTREYFLEKTNETRAAEGIAPVELDYDLCIIATIRTFELTYGNTLTHNRPDGQRFFTILNEYGYKAGYYNGTKHYGENMAYWQYTDASAYTALINSSGHKQNILDSRWKKMGVGVFNFNGRRYWIQLFTT